MNIDTVNILAVETSGEYCSAALWCNGDIRQEIVAAEGRHSQLLLGQCRQVLASAGLTFAQLQCVAAGVGPGSFTGVRIACSVAQGIALAAGVPVAGVVSLLAQAAAQPHDAVLVCQDARMGEVYHAAYRRVGGVWEVVSPPQVSRPERIVLPDDGPWWGSGNGFVAYAEPLAALAGKLRDVVPDAHPQAAVVASLAATEFLAGRGCPAEQLLPLYVRDRVALKIGER